MAVQGVCLPAADNAFGPTIDGCRDNFDFTLKFEHGFFSIAPSAAMILIGIIRVIRLQSRRRKLINAAPLKWAKFLSISVLAVFQLCLIILWATSAAISVRSIGVVASVLSFLASVIICLLSPLEHSGSFHPSTVLGVYLSFTLAFDAVTLRTVWLSPSTSGGLRGVSTCSFALKAVVLLLEAQGKQQYVVRPQDKVRSPEEFSGAYSRTLFWWLNRLLFIGFKKILKPSDLFVNKESLRTEHLNERFWTSWNSSSQEGKYALMIAVARALKWQLLFPIVPRLALLAFTFCQPLLLRRLLRYLQDPVEVSDRRTGYGLIGAYFLVYSGMALSSSVYWQATFKSISMLRGMLIAAIYRKTTTSDTTAWGEAKSVTLMGTDAERLVRGMQDMHELWANVIQVGLATWLLKVELGVACAGPLAVTAVSLGMTLAVASLTTKRQMAWMKAIEKRIGTTTAMLGSIKSIKMTGITSKISSTIHQLRLDEIKAARSFWLLGVFTSTVALVPQLMSPVATFAIFTADAVRQAAVLDFSRMFTSLSLLILLTQPLFELFLSIMEFMSALGCFARIQEYMIAVSQHDTRGGSKSQRGRVGIDSEIVLDSVLPSDTALKIMSGSFGWSPEAEYTLSGLNLSMPTSKLTLIMGPVASGKTTLLKGLLGEVPVSAGHVLVSNGPIAYCDQTPWLRNATIKENIMEYSNQDAAFYKLALHSCALDRDLANLQNGDQTLVGSKGIALSSGQKHRIALARAVFHRHEMMVLDDVFSQLDANVKMTVFANLLGPKGLLRKLGTTVLLATHDVNFLPHADLIVVLGKDGKVSEQGSFRQLRNGKGYIAEMLAHNNVDENAFHSVPDFDMTPKPIENPALPAQSEGSDDNNDDVKSADKSRQLGDAATYVFYFSCVGWALSAIFWILQFCYAFFGVFPVVWLKWWADENERSPNRHMGEYIGGYAGLQIAGVLSAGTLTWFCFYILAQKAGLQLHSRMLSSVVRAPLSLFWTTDSGSLTTRFSQDFQYIDSSLPLAMMQVATNLLICLGQAGLIVSASVWLVVSIPPLVAVVWLVQRYYLRTSRQLRLLDLEAKAPLYTQFMESLSGLATIRAFGWQDQCVDRNHDLIDRAQKPFYLLFMVQKWLALVLDLLVMALAVVVVGVIVALRDKVSVGFSGVSLTQLISFTGYLKLLILFWTSMETSLGAVMRIKQFSEQTPREHDEDDDGQPFSEWPATGSVSLRDVSVVYRGKTDHKALENVSLEIKPGEKIGICGRTGSGKTTLALALLNMVDLESGQIIIDGKDTASMGVSYLRSQLNAVPDEPFFLPGSLRSNIDIDSKASDEQVRHALKSVLLQELSNTEDLNAEWKPDNLSHGQKQLFALARATLQPNKKIVILDEVTSRIDKKSDETIQRVIRSAFADSTVIAIAHRLENIMDFDRVAVLDNKRLVEFDNPQALLAKPSSAFKSLVQVYRKEMADERDAMAGDE
ncbi:ABC transporter [Myriangium duriaei CBS 260.36]|uniref:ABC transporter n=1 Tax=Myriangium duriaei CBS 260.36 TaxID=1168546 RepID=A0A9P4MHQ5_9PEZI|nr:ABC transporter [Myriangium duriaei CBS 260.36]